MFLFSGFLSVLFLLIGSIIAYSHIYYKRYGKRISGKVIGIEKYVSTTRSSNTTSKRLMYRPIIKFIIEGSEYIFVGGGRNTISYIAGEKIQLLNISNNPKLTKIDSKLTLLFGLCFILFGLMPGYHFISDATNLTVIFACLAGYFLVLYTVYKKIQHYNEGESLFTQFLSISKFETKESLKGREIFTTHNQIIKEEGKHFLVGMIITIIFFGAMLALFLSCYSDLSKDSLAFIENSLSFNFTMDNVASLFKRDPKLIGVSFSFVMMVLLSYSILFQLKGRNS
jgi:hypothetical protein